MPVNSAHGRMKPAGRRNVGRVLIEFPEALLQRADAAARSLDKNRSELIREAVAEKLDAMEARRFEAELAAAYAANADHAHELAEEFAHVDAEGF